MKLLIVSALLCAMMALTTAVALGDEEDISGTEDRLLTGEHHVVKTYRRCPHGWKRYRKRCFSYLPYPMSWSQAQNKCEQMQGNLASVQSHREHKFIQKLIFRASRERKPTWLGGSAATVTWTWIDGTIFRYTNWCLGEPSNRSGPEDCLEMNVSEKKCWNAAFCSNLRPSVCVKNIW